MLAAQWNAERNRYRAAGALLVLALCLTPAAAQAHGQPIAIDYWGGYSLEIARCQRAISRAASGCAARAVAQRTACLSAQVDGATCELAAAEAAIQSARAAALDRVDAACSENQLRVLQFVDRADALNDVISVCRNAETAAVSAAFGPKLIGGASFVYNDPVVLRFDPPLALPQFDRSFTYCSLYDNGATDPTEVKRQSTSPIPGLPLGGPCDTPTHCMAGKLYVPCSGTTKTERDRSCDSSPDVHDGLCDACTLTGGITTEDEMFVLLGRYYVP